MSWHALRKLTGKQTINIMIFGVWVAAITTTICIPTEWYGSFVFNNTVETKSKWTQSMDPYRPVSYQAVVTAKTAGVFSAANPIDIEVRILDANITDLTRDYTKVQFLDAKKFTQGSALPLEPSKDGGWIAKGRVTLHEADRIWMFLSPDEPPKMSLIIYSDEAEHIMSQEEILNLGPPSDTLTLQFNSFAAKVAFALGTFSILLLAPIFEAMFIRENKNESNNNQNNAEQKSRQPKK